MDPRSALVADRVAVDSAPAAPDVNSSPNGSSKPNGTDTSLTSPVVPPAPASPERLAARRLIDQAKLLLMSHQQMSEPEAYRWIQKTAMNRRVTMATVAASIIAGLDPEPAPTQAEITCPPLPTSSTG